MVLLAGENGQGKTNLLEAVYMLAVARSPRSSSDRELVNWNAASEETYSRVAATVQRGGKPLRVQIDFRSTPSALPEEPEDDSEPSRRSPAGISVQKYLRVDGVPRRASGFVGQLNAVLFSAEDLELIYGTPSVRRRYMDILISQFDVAYLRALQAYQRVMTQRNSLLRSVRDGRSSPSELDFWDDQLVAEGVVIIQRRVETLRELSAAASPVHVALSGSDSRLALEYRPNVELSGESTPEAIERDFRRAMESRRGRELAQAVSVTGPHRDDLGALLDGMEVQAYASRGQARTVALAMKLAEAAYLRDQRRQEPVILLDDVFSELDPSRRAHVLETVSRYEQCIITTADEAAIGDEYLKRMARFTVRSGVVEPVTKASQDSD
jgi:DNA replication and repair protein RecF